MADWQKMYTVLCRAADEALDRLPADCGECAAVRVLLQQAMYRAEEIYMDSCDDDLPFTSEA